MNEGYVVRPNNELGYVKIKPNQSLINHAARDYDMEVHQVQNIYDRYFETGTFYDELEKFIEARANQY